jgi:hypothetical protein
MLAKLPSPPIRIAHLPKDHRGYPIPWFVAWLAEDLDGKLVEVDRQRPGAKADFRILGRGKRELAVKKRLCWVCGEPLGVHQVFPIGPMCSVNRTTMEPPCHRACAEYSATACPFLTVPARRRNEEGLDMKEHHVAGDMIARNPGAIALWESGYRIFEVHNGWLIRLGEPTRVDWWTKGRHATRAEVLGALDAGYPSLVEAAHRDGPEALEELERLRLKALDYLPRAA